MRRRAVLVALLAATAAARAQDGSPGARERELAAELAAERAALAELEGAQQGERAADEARRHALAAELLELASELETLRREGPSLEERVQAAETTARERRAAVAALEEAGLQAAEQLRILCAEIPGAGELAERLPRSPEDLEESGLRGVLELADRLHEQAVHVGVHAATLRLADGTLGPVHLLSVGLAAFAYEDPGHARFALALRAPLDASGYRWVEALPPEREQELREAFQALESGTARRVEVPVDPTGALRPDATLAEPLAERVRSGGLVMIPLAGVALIALLLILERSFVLYGRNRDASALVAATLEDCREGRAAEAERRVAGRRGCVARTLAACLRRRSAGQEAMEDSIQEQLLHELPRLQRFLGGIATLAAVAPLLGLLGTVTGIIRTFGVIRAFGNANPKLMAGGISEALVTTVAGLSIAIPVVLLHVLLRARAEKTLGDAERHAASLLNTLTHDSRVDSVPA